MKTRSNKVVYQPPAAPNPIHNPGSKPFIETACSLKTSSDDDNNSSSSDSSKSLLHDTSSVSPIKSKRSNANDSNTDAATDSNDNVIGDFHNDGKSNVRSFYYTTILC